MPLILPGNVATATAAAGYDVANSCRFEDGDTAYMHKTCSSAFDTDKWTISIWFKRGNLGAATRLISCDNDDGENDDYIRFTTSDTIQFLLYSSGSVIGRLDTNMRFRDTAAWYHLVCVWDSANGTAGNRMRMYVNGTEVTSFAEDSNPTSGVNASWGNTSHPIEVGRRGSNGTQYFDGYIAEVAVCDGQAYAASDFGEFDEDSPTIWKPKDVSGLTFGTSGFYLDFEDSANLGNDANGGTDFTEVNLAAADQMTDTPTNNFATINNLQTNTFDPATTTFSEGNTKHVNAGSAAYNSMWLPTIGVTAGKWYGEFKLGAHSTSSGHSIGIIRVSGEPNLTGGDIPDADMIRIIFADTANIVKQFDSSVETGLGSCSSGDIFGLYFDADNGKLHCYKGGSAYITQITGLTIAGYTWFLHTQGEVQSTRNLTFEHNYGNPSFSITSTNADPNGYGSFEYSTTENSVDYYALNTKNLAEFG